MVYTFFRIYEVENVLADFYFCGALFCFCFFLIMIIFCGVLRGFVIEIQGI